MNWETELEEHLISHFFFFFFFFWLLLKIELLSLVVHFLRAGHICVWTAVIGNGYFDNNYITGTELWSILLEQGLPEAQDISAALQLVQKQTDKSV